ncbi:MAG: ribonuclease III [Lachnospiraceae bacterium]|nr:ribonuclease III [Lachnospiraceae bacterium]
MLRESSLNELEQKIGYCFKDRALLKQALTHSSFANEQRINRMKDYERLEFLGDAVLELASSEFLYAEYPKLSEGDLTKKRSTMVCGASLAFCARDIELDRYILLGKGEEATGGRGRESIISDVMEAVIGAIYLDGGYEPASRFIHRFVLSDLEHKQLFYDSKTLLQEYVQKDSRTTLHYVVVEETGPDHAKEFVIEAMINGQVLGRGVGKTKKAAEQQAAYEALLASRGKELGRGYVFKEY